MPDRTLRTIGASVVLAALVVAGVAQVGSRAEAPPAEIFTSGPSQPVDADRVDDRSSSTAPEPFVYRIGVLSGISTDNFWAYYGAEPSVWNSYILGPTKPALYSLDSSGTLDTELAIAQVEPTWDANGWRVRVDLESSFRWSDGEPVTAEDYVFTFETVRRLGLQGSWEEAYPAAIESVHADGEHQLRIEFVGRPDLSVWPYGPGLAPVMAEHVWSRMVTGGTAEQLYMASGADDVSGGPLTLASVSETRVVSEANPGYPDPIGPDTVEYHVYADEAALVAAIGAGDVDTLLTPRGITAEQVGAIGDAGQVEVLASPANAIRYLGFNLAREPMADQPFRTALALLLDREALTERIPHTGDVAWSYLPESNQQWFDSEAAGQSKERYSGTIAERLAQAVAGLAEAGYTWQSPPQVGADGSLVAGIGLAIDGLTPQPLTILTPGDAYDPSRPEYVEQIAATLGILGFDTRPVETDFDTVVDLAFTPGEDGTLHYDMYLLGWTLGNPALPDFYRPLFSSTGEMNNTGYASATFDQALAAYESAHSGAEARDALWAMEQTLGADLPYLLLYTGELTEAYRSDRVAFDALGSLGGLQARLGGIADVRQSD